MRWIVVVAAVEVAATGLFLFTAPLLFVWLILGAELPEAGQALGRLGGIVMFGFGLVAGFAPAASQLASVVRGLAIYNTLATIYLGYLAIAGKLVGLLLWPAIAVHAVLAIFVVRAWLAATKR